MLSVAYAAVQGNLHCIAVVELAIWCVITEFAQSYVHNQRSIFSHVCSTVAATCLLQNMSTMDIPLFVGVFKDLASAVSILALTSRSVTAVLPSELPLHT